MEKIVDQFNTLTSQMSPTHSTLFYRFNSSEKKPLLLILPGGGYAHLSGEKEGSTIAKWAESLDFHAAVLAYQVNPVETENLLVEISEVLDFLQSQKEVGEIFVMGFSAGAHLAGLFSALHHEKIAGTLYCYPVVTFSPPFAHSGSAENFLGARQNLETEKKFSLENAITKQTPPAFIWHTAADQAVPVANSLLLAKAYADAGVPFELHIFPQGHHGLGMLPEVPHTFQWVKLAQNWLLERRK
ncbi:alpha/beta hydrolase [Enterococcus timonensis]|uniref:alpha/beta hydrolase n=1 Tax=Enterococcus timonensis TaxID=1852364 RepID=UPI0008DA4653|nr:alpha/beta hydrolase [Enterococcus timonensis]